MNMKLDENNEIRRSWWRWDEETGVRCGQGAARGEGAPRNRIPDFCALLVPTPSLNPYRGSI